MTVGTGERRTRRGGRGHGAAMMVWMFIANLFDPPSAIAVQQLDVQRRTGGDHRHGDRTGAAGPLP